MYSQATELAARLLKGLKTSTATRIAALTTVVMAAAIVGPPGLAVGPTLSRTSNPALPTGAAMEARNVLSSITISFDLMQSVASLTSGHESYPERNIGALSFPDGAIDVPWTDVAWAPGNPGQPATLTERGNTVSRPQLLTTSVSPSRAAIRNSSPSADLRSVILFDRQGTDLNGEASDALDRLAETLQGNNDRIQLRAFGGNIAERSHMARRLALRRALSVRNYLMTQGIDQERITVRAMGGAIDGGPSDRVDVVFDVN